MWTAGFVTILCPSATRTHFRGLWNSLGFHSRPRWVSVFGTVIIIIQCMLLIAAKQHAAPWSQSILHHLRLCSTLTNGYSSIACRPTELFHVSFSYCAFIPFWEKLYIWVCHVFSPEWFLDCLKWGVYVFTF